MNGVAFRAAPPIGGPSCANFQTTLFLPCFEPSYSIYSALRLETSNSLVRYATQSIRSIFITPKRQTKRIQQRLRYNGDHLQSPIWGFQNGITPCAVSRFYTLFGINCGESKNNLKFFRPPSFGDCGNYGSEMGSSDGQPIWVPIIAHYAWYLFV